MTNEQKKDFALLIYLNETSATQKEIAQRVEVSEQTISKWVKTENWEKQRRSKMVTRQKALDNAYEQLENLNATIMARPEGERIPNNKEADVQVKLASQIRTLETELSNVVVMEIGMKFIDHVRNVAPENTTLVLNLYDNFMKTQLARQ